MPLFKGVASKAKPKKAIDYITKDEKAVIISSISLDDSRDYATQFKETCDLFGKGSGHGERKYYHFKLSCDPNDNPTPQQSHDLAERIASEIFSGHECVIATHADTDVFHSHIIINAVSFETGKKFHMWRGAYGEAKDLADIFGETYGFTKLDWRTKTEIKLNRIIADEAITPENKHLSNAERNIAKRKEDGIASWKEALRQAIDEAKACCTDRAEFQKYLKEVYDIDMPRNTARTVSFVHPAVGETKDIRGTKLGCAYTADSIDRALNENVERSVENARLFVTQEEYSATDRADSAIATDSYNPIIPSQSTTQAGNGERITPRSISGISAELRGIDEAVYKITKPLQQFNKRTVSVDSEPIGENESNNICRYGNNQKNDTTEQEKSSKLSNQTTEHERSVQQKPKRRSKSYER